MLHLKMSLFLALITLGLSLQGMVGYTPYSLSTHLNQFPLSHMPLSKYRLAVLHEDEIKIINECNSKALLQEVTTYTTTLVNRCTIVETYIPQNKHELLLKAHLTYDHAQKLIRLIEDLRFSSTFLHILDEKTQHTILTKLLDIYSTCLLGTAKIIDCIFKLPVTYFQKTYPLLIDPVIPFENQELLIGQAWETLINKYRPFLYDLKSRLERDRIQAQLLA